MLKWLYAGANCVHEKTMRTCSNVLDLQNSLWHFFTDRNVPTTNNHAERQLRPLVITKKLTFGTQLKRGSRFIERIFTIITTYQQQKRDAFDFIINAIKNYFLKKINQSLLYIEQKA